MAFGAALVAAWLVPLAAVRTAGAAEGDPLTGGMDPADLLATFQQAARDRDVAVYADCLADSFSFTPYSGAVADFPDFDFDGWDRARETAFARDWLLLRGGGSLDLSRVVQRVDVGLDRAEWDVDYRMGVGYGGRATMVMIRRGQRWYLSEWIDTAAASDERGDFLPTSGELRAMVMR